MKIYKAQARGKFSRGLVRFMISGKHPELLAEQFENVTAALQSLAKSREVPGVDVDVRGLRHNARERFEIAVDVAEDEHLHGVISFAGGLCIRIIIRVNIPVCSHPSATTFPASSKTTRYENGCGVRRFPLVKRCSLKSTM